jgi:GTP-binding protein EngB required for normal cell division
MEGPQVTEARELELDEVLRRCHRDELLPLAEVMRVSPEGLRRDRLARAIEHAIRVAGGFHPKELLQKRSGHHEWPELMVDLARRRGVEPAQSAAETEQLLLADWRQKGDMDPEVKKRLVAVIGDGERPAEPLTAPVPWKPLPVMGVALFIGRLFLPFLIPLAGLRFMMWLFRPHDDLLLPATLLVAELRRRVASRITVGLVGTPSSGKDAAVKALFGLDTGNINPVAGSTREVCVYRIPGVEGLEVVNTPGLGDVLQALTDETRDTLDHIDLYIFLVNAQGGVRAREKDEWTRCVARRRPVLAVVNKVDTLRESDRPRFLGDVAQKLGAETVLGAAFDPLPQLAPSPIGVAPIRDWIDARLAEVGKPHLPPLA